MEVLLEVIICSSKPLWFFFNSKVKDFTALYKFLFDEIDNYAKGHIASVILILAEAQYQDAMVVDHEINAMAMFVKLLNEI